MKLVQKIFLFIFLASAVIVEGAVAKPVPDAPGIAKIKKRGVLRVALPGFEIPPFIMTDGDKLVGLEVEYAREIAEQLGVRVEFNRTAQTFNGVVEVVARGEADMAFSKLSFTPARAQKVFYTRPYCILKKALMINRLRHAEVLSKREANTLSELLNHESVQIAVIGNSSYEGFMKQLFPKAQLVGKKQWLPDIWQAVSSRKSPVLAAARDDLEIGKLLRFFPEANLEIEAVFLKGQEDPIRGVVDPNNVHLKDFVDNFLGNKKVYSATGILDLYKDFFQKYESDFREKAQG